MSAQERQALAEGRDDLLAALAWSFEQGDAVAAAQLVVVLAVSWMCPGDAQGRAWLERVLATPEPVVHPARVRTLVSLALILHDAGEDRPRAEELLGQAEDLAVRVGDAGELAACRLARVEVDMACGRTASARAHTEAALAAYEALGEAAGVGWCHHGLGWIAVAEGDDRRGSAHFERALALARSDAGGGWLLPHALAALAPLVAREGDARRSLRLADEAVEAARPFGVRAVLAMALARAAETAVVADDLERAGRVVAELVRLLLDLATRRWAADALEVAAIVLARRGDDAGAATAVGASQVLRAAADGQGGAVRPVDAAVRTSSARRHDGLGADRFDAAVDRGRALVPEAALAEVLAALEASTPGNVRAEGT
jgi:tetratricopeptide (TPR) repeat protein